MSFGYLTMAASQDGLLRARCLARSLLIHEPTASISLLKACPDCVVPAGCFDEVIEVPHPERFSGRLRYLNKLHYPPRLSPYSRTLFLDDDTLVLGSLKGIVEREFYGLPIALNSQMEGAGSGNRNNHLVASRVMETLGVASCRNVYGGGHMYFERSESSLEITEAAIATATASPARYQYLAGQSVVSDEIALMIIANERELVMPTMPDFVDALSLWQANEIRLDVIDGRYEWRRRPWGSRIQDVRILHFCSRAKRALPYRREIWRLVGKRQSFDQGLVGLGRRLVMEMRKRWRAYERWPKRGRI